MIYIIGFVLVLFLFICIESHDGPMGSHEIDCDIEPNKKEN